MSVKKKNLSDYHAASVPDGSSFKVGIAVSAWNEQVTQSLLDGCTQTLKLHGVSEDQIYIEFVPGSFELPMAVRLLLNRYKLDAVIGLGCVIKGETNHDEYINHAVATGFTELSLYTGVPCIYGVVTTLNFQQAMDRAGGSHGNKGVECAVTALRMADLRKRLATSDSSIGFRK